MHRLVFSSILIAFLILACIKTEPVSPIPEVEFKNYELFEAVDTLGNHLIVGKLEFSFIDGDADFGMDGLWDTVTWNERNYNVFLKPYEKIDTLYYPIPDDSTKPPPYYRVMRDTPLDRVGQNKTVKGFIRIEMYFFIIPEYDTLRYDFYIVDRALNKSNIESTSDIGFKGISLPPPGGIE
jgi:hypothetical protein